MLPQAEAKRRQHISCTSLGLHLRQDCRVQRFVPHLDVLGSFCFLLTRYFSSFHLQKKLPNVKH
jgi:hypothetical protein